MFFNFHKYSSVSDMFVQIGLTSVGTVCHTLSGVFRDVLDCVIIDLCDWQMIYVSLLQFCS